MGGFFSREAGQKRRAALNEALGETMRYYLGPTGIPERVETLGDLLNPVGDMESAGRNADALFSGDATGRERFNAGVGMATDMATALAPLAGAKYGEAASKAIADALTGGMTGQGVGNAARDFLASEHGGIKAFHGSPHDFDKFSMDKIGTGEGAQAYGHGLYFAENEGVARSYRDALASRAVDRSEDLGTIGGKAFRDLTAEEKHALRMVRVWGDPQRAADAAVRQDVHGEMLGRASILNKMASGELPYTLRQGRMYEVDINADPDEFLDWDAPLSAQPASVQDIARNMDLSGLSSRQRGKIQKWRDGTANELEMPSGNELHSALTDFGTDGARNAALTENLNAQGIPGIKYRDAGSRGAESGTRNFVVFDENLINIVRKYGIAGAAAMLGLSAAEVEAATQDSKRKTMRDYLNGL